MSIPVHVVTVVGGFGVDILPHTIRHYQALGVRSFFIIVNLREHDDAFAAKVADLARSCGVAIESIEIDPDLPACKKRSFTRVMSARPNDWFLPIDADELQCYPSGLFSALEHCERHGYDYVRGCMVDRVSRDGTLAPLRADVSIWSQYPLGGFLTYPLLGGDPRKVVAARGRLVLDAGQHEASGGIGCPSRELFIPVHHFKWVATIVPTLRLRRDLYKRLGKPWWIESERALAYFASHGLIDLADRRLLIASCNPEYQLWDRILQMALDVEAHPA